MCLFSLTSLIWRLAAQNPGIKTPDLPTARKTSTSARPPLEFILMINAAFRLQEVQSCVWNSSLYEGAAPAQPSVYTGHIATKRCLRSPFSGRKVRPHAISFPIWRLTELLHARSTSCESDVKKIKRGLQNLRCPFTEMLSHDPPGATFSNFLQILLNLT